MNKKRLVLLSVAFVSIVSTVLYARKRFDGLPSKLVQLVKRTYTTWHFPYTHSGYQRKHLQEKPMIMVVPSYQNAQWYEHNIKSILMQDYQNYRVIYIADGCGEQHYDGTGELVEQLLKTSPLKDKFTLIKNTRRCGALANLYHAIHSCPDEAIIVTLDGDDWFYHDQVLALLNDLYTEKDIWFTHGSFVEYPTGFTRWSEAIPEEIITKRAVRMYKCASHCRTFYAWLFKRILLDDLLDQEGNFYPMTWDQAIMFPIEEMAAERHAFVEDYIYVYNTANQINDWKVNLPLQQNTEKMIRAKQPYTRLEQK